MNASISLWVVVIWCEWREEWGHKLRRFDSCSRAGVSTWKSYFEPGRYVEAEQQLVRQYRCLSYDEYRVCCNPAITLGVCIPAISKMNYYTISYITLMAEQYSFTTRSKNTTHEFKRYRHIVFPHWKWTNKIIGDLEKEKRYFIATEAVSLIFNII